MYTHMTGHMCKVICQNTLVPNVNSSSPSSYSIHTNYCVHYHRYQMMLDCWSEKPPARPTFTQLRNWVEAMIEANSSADYITFDVNQDKDYYRLQTCASTTNDDDDVFTSNCTSSTSTSLTSEMSEPISGSVSSLSSSTQLPCHIREGWHPNKVNRVAVSTTLQVMGASSDEAVVRVRQPAKENLRVSTCSTENLIPPVTSSTTDSSYSSEVTTSWLGDTRL